MCGYRSTLPFISQGADEVGLHIPGGSYNEKHSLFKKPVTI